jgi:hypothetical protein
LPTGGGGPFFGRCKLGALDVAGLDGLPGTGGAAAAGGRGAARGSASESDRYEES